MFVHSDQYQEFRDVSMKANAGGVAGSALVVGGLAGPAGIQAIGDSVPFNQTLLVAGAAQQTLVRSTIVRVTPTALSIPIVGDFTIGLAEGAYEESGGIPFPSRGTPSAARNIGQAIGHLAIRANRAFQSVGTPAGVVLKERFRN